MLFASSVRALRPGARRLHQSRALARPKPRRLPSGAAYAAGCAFATAACAAADAGDAGDALGDDAGEAWAGVIDTVTTGVRRRAEKTTLSKTRAY